MNGKLNITQCHVIHWLSKNIDDLIRGSELPKGEEKREENGKAFKDK